MSTTVRLFLFFLFSSFFLLPGFSSLASHNMGGEITWRCVGSKYVFRATYYKDCDGIPFSPSGSEKIEILPAGTFTGMNIPVTMVRVSDITPLCKGDPFNCGTPPQSGTGKGKGSVAKIIFESAPVTLSGAGKPPASGYTIVFKVVCCRNPNDNTDCSSGDMIFRAKMYQYIQPPNPNPKAVDNCFDNSPAFSEAPVSIIVSSPIKHSFNNNATDLDMDSLSYAFDYPWIDVDEQCEFLAPYSVNAPLPNLLPNQPNKTTGEVHFTAQTAGVFLTCIRVDAWKCGQRVASIYRDFQSQIISDPSNTNTMPQINAPFYGGTRYDTTITAGDTVLFRMCVSDNNPSQKLDLLFNGIQFGDKFRDQTQGCPLPPCAVLSSTPDPVTGVPPDPIIVRTDTVGYGYSGLINVCGYFYWATSCDNIKSSDCGLVPSIFNFVLTATDDYCNIPGKVFQTISITVVPPVPVAPPEIHCVEVVNDHTVKVTWDKPPGDSTQFLKYYIYTTNDNAGSYALLDSVTQFTTLTYTDTFVDLKTNPDRYYYIGVLNKCINKDTIGLVRIMRLDATLMNGTKAMLNWNPIRDPYLPTADSVFKIYRMDSLDTWNLVGSTTNTYFEDTYNDFCRDTVYYKIEQADSYGCVSVSTVDTVSLTPLLVSATTNIPCKDGTTYFTPLVSGGNPGYAYSYVGDGGFSAAIANPSHVYPAPGKYGYTFTVTDQQGCSMSFTDSATVLESLSLGIDADTVCVNNSTTLKPLILGGTPPYTFTWTGDGGFASTDSVATYIFPNGAGKYKVTLQVADGFGCGAVFTDSIVVADTLTVNFTATNLCEGDSTILSGFASGGKPLYTFEWSGGGFVSSQAQPKIVFPKSDTTYTIQLKVTDLNGCAGVITKNIFIGTVPSFLLASDTICFSDTLRLSAAILKGSNLKYQWSASNGFTSAQPAPLFIYSQPGTYTIGLILTDTVGKCSDTASTTVVVRDLPDFNYTWTATCAGRPVQFTATVNGVPNGHTFDWKGPGFQSNQQNPQHTFIAGGTYPVVLYVTDANGCMDSLSKNVILNENVQTTYTADSQCTGMPITFQSTIQGGIGPYTYQWSGPSGFSSTDKDPVHSFDTAGNLQVLLVVTDQTGCSGTYSSSVLVYDLPQVDFTHDTVCVGQPATFEPLITGGIPPYSYEWTSNFGFTSADEKPVHIFNEKGQYQVMLRVLDQKGCEGSVSKTLSICKPDVLSYLYIPNAVSFNNDGVNDELILQYHNLESFRFSVFNRWGEQVFSTSDPATTWKGKDDNGNSFPEGVYVYIVKALGTDQREHNLAGTISIVK